MLLGEAARAEDVRRKAGDRGEFLPPKPCKELNDVRLCNVGVVGRSLPPAEPELGALRRGVLLEFNGPEMVPDSSGAIGEEGGKGVEAAVESDRRFFVDMAEYLECSLFFSVVFSIFTDMLLLRAALHHCVNILCETM